MRGGCQVGLQLDQLIFQVFQLFLQGVAGFSVGLVGPHALHGSFVLGGQVAASRPIVDNGWLPHEDQIGQSGATVKPDHIINIAISGSVQYQVGMQNSKCIISINHTAGVPIFDISHYGAVADYRSLVPAIIEEIKKRK